MSGFSLSLYQSTPSTRIWAIVPGIREIILVILVVVALYGRSGKVRSGRFFSSGGWTNRPSGRKPPAAFLWLMDRWWLVLATLAGVGVAAWVTTSWIVARAWALR